MNETIAMQLLFLVLGVLLTVTVQNMFRAVKELNQAKEELAKHLGNVPVGSCERHSWTAVGEDGRQVGMFCSVCKMTPEIIMARDDDEY